MHSKKTKGLFCSAVLIAGLFLAITGCKTKIAQGQFSCDPEVMERFLAEAKAVNTIGHQNIIDIFAFGNFDDGSQYFVMEYLKGQSLTQYLRDHRPLAYDNALDIFTQVTEALEAAHEHGIVHRDLKPDNVYIADKPGAGGAEGAQGR